MIPKTKKGHRLTWKRKFKTTRHQRLYRTEEFKLPIDLRPVDTPIDNQEQEGSCTAFAGCGAFKFLWKKSKDVFFDASQQFLYSTERIIDGDLADDEGSSLHTSAIALQQYGVCTNPEWPYVTEDEFQYPPNNIFQEASGQKINGYKNLATPDDRFNCLASGNPFVFGLDLYSNFENTGPNGIVNIPSSYDNYEGGHALLCVGAIMINEILYYIVKNSWGITWGDNGYCYIAEDYMDNSQFADEFIQYSL